MINGKQWLGVLGVVVLLAGGCQSPALRLSKEGLAQYKSSDYPTAYETFSKALTYDQFNAENNYYAGMSAFQMGRYDTAGYHLRLAWQKDPSLGDVKEALTEILIREGKPDEALNFLDRDAELTAKTKDPRLAKTVNKRPYKLQTEEGMYLRQADDRCRVAKVYEKLGDLDNAAVNYERALTMAPHDPEILMTAGQFYARVNQRTKAAKLFEKAYNIDPQTPGLAEAIQKSNMTVK